MLDSIQPRLIGSAHQSKERYAFFIDSEDFAYATKQAVQAASGYTEKEHHALDHLTEVAKTTPEICVVLDRQGNMSAWGLENVGCKIRKSTDIFNVAHVENFTLPFLQNVKAEEDCAHFLTFCGQKVESSFTLLVHHFDGRVSWSESSYDELFDPSPRQDRLHRKALWTGHDGSVKKIVRSGSGKSLISRTNDNEGLIWKQESAKDAMILTRSSSISCEEHIHRTCLLEEGDYVVNLHNDSISVWDARSLIAVQRAACQYDADGKPLCLILLPNSSNDTRCAYLATITSRMKGIAWKVRLSDNSATKSAVGQIQELTIEEFCVFDLGSSDELAFVLPVDPAGSSIPASGFLDTFAKDLAISYTKGGEMHAWTAVVELESSAVKWLRTSTIETGIDEPSLASASSIRKTALVDASKSRLTIWDPWSGQLEYDTTYKSYETIQDLDWSSTPHNQSILAVGFPYKVVILAQMRYDYMNAGPAWASIREIHIKELTSHPIGDSTWLGSGNLVVGAGNQLYVYDEAVATSDPRIIELSVPVRNHDSLNIFDLVTYLNGPLPVFHPQFLSQCILAGKLAQVQRIILGLHKALKFFVAGDDLDSFVSLPVDEIFNDQEVR